MGKKVVRYFRWIILAAILVYITYEAYLHQVLGGDKAASEHALCPFGGLESLYSLLFSGTYIQKVFVGTMIIFGLTIVITILFRRSFCGLLCPFGALQEFFAKIGQMVLGKRYIIPKSIDRPLRYFKYVVLILTVVAAWWTKGLWMSPYDPYVAYGHISVGYAELIDEYLIGVILLIVTIVGSFIYDRFFCKYICPAGAIYAIIGKISPNKIVRDENACIHCKLCSKSCPVNIDVEKVEKVISAECISCQECVNVCPKKDVIEIKMGSKSISSFTTIILVLGIFFGGIFATQQLGWYQTTPKPLALGEKLEIDEIKGYMTLDEVSKGMNIDSKELYKRLNIPGDIPLGTKLKDISQYVEDFSTDTAKIILENNK